MFASISACDILLSISKNSEKSILLLSPLISSSPLSTRYIMLLSIVPSIFTLPFIISFLYIQIIGRISSLLFGYELIHHRLHRLTQILFYWLLD